MHDLKGIGAVNATVGRPRGLTGKSRMRALRDAYDRLRVDGRLPATYEVVYGHGWAPEGGVRIGTPAEIAVSTVRRSGRR